MEPLDDFFSELGTNWNTVGGLTVTDDNEYETEFEELYRELEEAGTGLLAAKDPLASEGEDSQTGHPSTGFIGPHDLDPKLSKIKGLSSLAGELSEELAILLFFQNKCLMKNKKYTNFLRNAQQPTYPLVQAAFKNKFKTPYISTPTDSGQLAHPLQLAVPSASSLCMYQFPFQHEETREWKCTELDRLELCVYNSYYHRQLFFIESRFEQILLDMGFSVSDLNQLHTIHVERNEELWSAIKSDKVSEGTKKEKYYSSLNKSMIQELKLIQTLVNEHENAGSPILPYTIRCSTSSSKSMKLTIDLKDLIAWKQQETRTIFIKRFTGNESIELSQVDWIFVEKEMFAYCKRTATGDDYRRTYEFCKSEIYNHGPTTTKELNELKMLTANSRDLDGLSWEVIAKQLNTNRAPVRIYQTYKKYIWKPPCNALMQNYNHRLEVFLQVKKYLGNIPRVVQSLSKNFGEIKIDSFKNNWQEINPKFTVGNFFPHEDAALLVVMEMFSPTLIKGKNFSVIQHRLPWRHCTAWRRRAEFLFHNLDNWSYDEDQLLLFVIKEYGKNWPGLSKVFNRRPKYSILFRYNRLVKKLEHFSLEQYHAIYSRRISKSGIKLFDEICDILRNIIDKNPLVEQVCDVPDISGNIEDEEPNNQNSDQIALGLENSLKMTLIKVQSQTEQISGRDGRDGWIPLSTEPNRNVDSFLCNPSFNLDTRDIRNLDFLEEIVSSNDLLSVKNSQSSSEITCGWKTITKEQVQKYLTTFDKKFLLQTLERLAAYKIKLQTRLKSASDESSKLAMKCNRRRFIIDDPVSVASALNLRGIPLKHITDDAWETLSEFEKNVCRAYQIFKASSYTKKTSSRKSIPSETELSFLPTIKNIINAPKAFSSTPTRIQEIAAPMPPLEKIKLENNISSLLPFDPIASIVEPSSIEGVELVQPTRALVNARNKLCRRVWNSKVENSSKIKTISSKKRRKALNAAAARARWNKTTEKNKDLDDSLIMSKKNDVFWYDNLLNNYGNNYTGGFENLLEDNNMEYENWKSPGHQFLNVLHDHSYASGYVSLVQNVVDDIRTTLLGADDDSSKENTENCEQMMTEN